MVIIIGILESWFSCDRFRFNWIFYCYLKCLLINLYVFGFALYEIVIMDLFCVIFLLKVNVLVIKEKMI